MIHNLLTKDKLLHFMAGVVIAAVLYPYCGDCTFLVTAIIGLIIFDLIFPITYPSISNTMATAAGGLLVTLIAIMSTYI